MTALKLALPLAALLLGACASFNEPKPGPENTDNYSAVIRAECRGLADTALEVCMRRGSVPPGV